MGLKFKAQQYGDCFFITTCFYQHRPLGKIDGVFDRLAESMVHYAARDKARLAGYVFMPSHLHLLILIEGRRIGPYMRDFKKYTAQKTIVEIHSIRPPIWEQGFDRVGIFSERVFRTKLDYIHNNPVKAGLCGAIEDWYWSSGRDYMGREDGPIAVWKDWG